jgi:P27 family predicted phage terminase small subunit
VAPRCPARLSKEEKSAWKQLVAMLKENDILTVADGNAMARYCVMWCEWWRCDAHVKKYGISFPLKRVIDRGKPTERTEVIGFQPFPELTQRNKLSTDLSRLETEFGLTPAARGRIQVDPHTLKAPAVRKRERRA